MEINFSDTALKDLKYWKKSNNIQIQERIKLLIDSILENPTQGLGSPEPLKFEYSGFCSRIINKEHRLVYRFDENSIEIIQLRFHY